MKIVVYFRRIHDFLLILHQNKTFTEFPEHNRDITDPRLNAISVIVDEKRMSKEIFSKFIPNVRLGTRFDADGKEIDVEIREDTEAAQCRKKIFDLLLSAGYFRTMIKTLSDFDKIVGGIVWCIAACECWHQCLVGFQFIFDRSRRFRR
jgi:hypothetical protein